MNLCRRRFNVPDGWEVDNKTQLVCIAPRRVLLVAQNTSQEKTVLVQLSWEEDPQHPVQFQTVYEIDLPYNTLAWCWDPASQRVFMAQRPGLYVNRVDLAKATSHRIAEYYNNTRFVSISLTLQLHESLLTGGWQNVTAPREHRCMVFNRETHRLYYANGPELFIGQVDAPFEVSSLQTPGFDPTWPLHFTSNATLLYAQFQRQSQRKRPRLNPDRDVRQVCALFHPNVVQLRPSNRRMCWDGLGKAWNPTPMENSMFINAATIDVVNAECILFRTPAYWNSAPPCFEIVESHASSLRPLKTCLENVARDILQPNCPVYLPPGICLEIASFFVVL